MSGAGGRSTAEPIALRERASATPRGPERPNLRPTEASADAAPASRSTSPAASLPTSFAGSRPTSLAAQQEWFARAVMTPESEASPVGASETASILTAGPQIDALGRLEIYRHGYHSRLIECLLDDYPAAAAALGEGTFDELCRKYIALYPSTGPNLNTFGCRMERLCRAEAAEPEVLRSRDMASFIADLAALEWAIVEVIHAASAEPLTMAGLANIPPARWGDARLVATPAFRLLRSRYPVNRYFQAFRQDESPAVPQPEEAAVVVYRSGPTIWRMDLSEAAFDLLHALTSGRTLAGAFEDANANESFAGVDESVAAARVGSWFRDWVSSGLFSGVEFS